MRILGAILLIAGIGMLLIPFFGLSVLGEGKIKGHTYCDVSGAISGLVRDYNPPIVSGVKDVINWDMTLANKAGTCEVYQGGILGSVGSDSGYPNPMALIGEGSVQITITVFNPANESVASHTFSVTTPSGTAEKTFTEQFLIRGLEKAVTYDFRVTHVWNSNAISYEESYTP